MGGERIGVVEPELGVGEDWMYGKAEARGEVVPVRVLKTAFRDTPYNLYYLRLAPAQGSDPKKRASAPAQAPAFFENVRNVRNAKMVCQKLWTWVREGMRECKNDKTKGEK